MSENNSISKPINRREKYKEKPSPKRQHTTGIKKTSEQRGKRVNNKHQTEKSGGEDGFPFNRYSHRNIEPLQMQ